MINKKFVRYGIVGAIGTITHLLILLLLVEILSFNPIISSSLAFIVVVFISYYLNYNWTFKSTTKHFTVLIRYIIVCLSGFTLNIIIMFIVVDVLNLYYMLGQIISIIVIPISNFILNNRWAFKV
ncbi:MAG: GtrA family protein [Dolichospermum sp. DET50]|jgi:putative flippase GtrA|nr:GtrA family protein [Dolichospermum sp. DET66]MBS3032504.1 GtrA family protein [Dolichospermum sp. DET67]MBS3037710.1 GtrA family protein [Dolichospermum sp. DET50]QSX69655.1 MAG: GtrA family protein [Dolichospermum sp. DET69]